MRTVFLGSEALANSQVTRGQLRWNVTDEFGNEFAYLDMGWVGVMIAVGCDGEQHRTDQAQYRWDVKRLRKVHERGWFHVKVIAGDRRGDVLQRVAQAWASRRDRNHGS